MAHTIELAANLRFAPHLVQNLDRGPVVPFADMSRDCCCVLDHCFRPAAVMREMRCVEKGGASVAVANRWLPTRAVLIWQTATIDPATLVMLRLARAGFSLLQARQLPVCNRGGEPLRASAPAGVE